MIVFLEEKIVKKEIELLTKRMIYLLKNSSIKDKDKLIELVNENPYAAGQFILDNVENVEPILKDTIEVLIEILTVSSFVDNPMTSDLTENGAAFYYGTLLVKNKKINNYEFISNRDNFYSKLQEDV